MAIKIDNTNYDGEVLEEILTLASTGNELVEKGLVHIETGIQLKKSIPRLKTTNMLQQRKPTPKIGAQADGGDSKGDFVYSEKELIPNDFMVYTEFNPRAFESIWRPFQPTGNLVFRELSPEVQNKLLEALAKQVKFELGWHYINGEKGSTDDKLINGFIFRMKEDTETIKALSSSVTMVGRLSVLVKYIPVTLRENPGLRIIMSIKDFDRYDAELKKQQFKGANYTDVTPERFNGIKIEKLANWPSGMPIATIATMDIDSNLWVGVDLSNDPDVIMIDRVTNSSEFFFFKLLMKADTQIAFGEEAVLLEKVAPEISADQLTLNFPTIGGEETVLITATEEFDLGDLPEGFSALDTEEGLLISAEDNTGGTAKDETLVVTLREHKSKKVTINLTQTA